MSAGLAVMVIFGGMGPIQISLLVVVILIMFGLRIPLHRGYVKAVSWFFVITLTVIITLVMAIGGTVRLPSISIFVLMSVIAGLILGQRAAYLRRVRKHHHRFIFNLGGIEWNLTAGW